MRFLTFEHKTPDGKYSESCEKIAIEIAKRLISEGKSPYIAEIKGKLVDKVNRIAIIPRPFNGRFPWSSYQVCCEGEKAYDPMLGTEPVLLKDYCKKAFYYEVDFEIIVSNEKIKEFYQYKIEVLSKSFGSKI